MIYNPDKHHRRSIRLKGYDYSKVGIYFVTICCGDQQYYFGRLEKQEMKLSTIGQIVQKNWTTIPDHFINVKLDKFVIMPNHLHGIIHILSDNGRCRGRGLINQTPTDTDQTPPDTDQTPPDTNKTLIVSSNINHKNSFNIKKSILMKNPRTTVGKIIRFFKAKSTWMIRLSGFKNFSWQRNYYERIVWNENELNRIRRYIDENPMKWETDDENPTR